MLVSFLLSCAILPVPPYGGGNVHELRRKEQVMIPTFYNEIAEWYDQSIRERPVYTEAILPCVMHLAGDVHGETICDLACGQGYIARELARRGANVTGVDLAPKLLEIAQRYEA